MRKLCLALAAATSAAVTFAQSAPPKPPAVPATAWLASQRLSMVGQDGRFSGAGWDRIIADGRKAHLFMIGEQHGSGTIANVETAFHRELATSGYDYAGLEIGPFSTRFVEQEIRAGEGRVDRFLAAPNHGFSIPFLFFAEEVEMAEQMVARSKAPQPVLWGLDQEFIGGAPVITELLRPRATTPARRSAIARWEAASIKEPFLLGSGPDAEIDALATAFAGDRVAAAIIDEMRSSRAIYAPFVGNGQPIYPANLARETGMKRHFQRQYEAAAKRTGKNPKVFLKFGGFHAMRGLSGTDVPSLANFLSEWGGSRGLGFVNIMIDCDGGQMLDPRSGKPVACEPYIGKDAQILAAAANGPPFQVYDFRAMRSELNRHKDLDAATRRAILAFDYYVVVRGGAASTPVGKLVTR